MPDETKTNDERPARDLPEAFTQPVNKADQQLKQVNGHTHTTSGLDRVVEGSEESFPASDPPSATPPTALPKTPVDPTNGA